MKSVVVIEEAAKDIELGKRFYDSREDGVGDYFVSSILSDLASLGLFAGIHIQQFGYYRALSKRFPFGIYYEVEDDTVFVYGVLDMRCDPLWIRNTMEHRTS